MGIVDTPDNDDDGNAILFEIIRSMRGAFGSWKIKQVEHAFDLGLAGIINVDMNMYNKPFNMVFLSAIMRAYKDYITPAIERERKNNQDKQESPSEAEQKEVINRNIKSEFERYKKTGRVNNYGNVIYSALKEKINVDEAELRPVAEGVYMDELEKKKTKTQIERSFAGVINDSISRAEMHNYNSNDGKRINRIICDLKLKSFFRQVLEMEMDIADIIDN